MASRRVTAFERALRRVTLADWCRAVKEKFPVSIQIVDAANPAARQELRERLASLRRSALATAPDENDKEGERDQRKAMHGQDVRALYHALTGYQLTDDELSELTGEPKDSGSEK